MSWISAAAIYFIIWWTMLFISLPFGLRTQDEEKDVTLGTVASAPRGPHMRRALILTTILSAVVYGALYYVTHTLGLGIDDIPRVVPTF